MSKSSPNHRTASTIGRFGVAAVIAVIVLSASSVHAGGRGVRLQPHHGTPRRGHSGVNVGAIVSRGLHVARQIRQQRTNRQHTARVRGGHRRPIFSGRRGPLRTGHVAVKPIIHPAPARPMTITTHHAPPRPENRFVQQARRGLQPAVARVALTNRSIGPDGNGPLPPTAAQRALDAQNRRNNAYGFYLANSKEANRLEAQRQAIANVRSVAEKLLEAALADYLKDRSPANFSRVDQQSRSVARSRAAEQSLAQQVAAQRNAAQRNYNIWQNGTP